MGLSMHTNVYVNYMLPFEANHVKNNPIFLLVHFSNWLNTTMLLENWLKRHNMGDLGCKCIISILITTVVCKRGFIFSLT
jgi:hypothetical protein